MQRHMFICILGNTTRSVNICWLLSIVLETKYSQQSLLAILAFWLEKKRTALPNMSFDVLRYWEDSWIGMCVTHKRIAELACMKATKKEMMAYPKLLTSCLTDWQTDWRTNWLSWFSWLTGWDLSRLRRLTVEMLMRWHDKSKEDERMMVTSSTSKSAYLSLSPSLFFFLSLHLFHLLHSSCQRYLYFILMMACGWLNVAEPQSKSKPIQTNWKSKTNSSCCLNKPRPIKVQ